MPASLERLRRKLQGSDDGDRQMVKVLSAVLTDGLAAVETACAEALADGVHSADVVLNILSVRQADAHDPLVLDPRIVKRPPLWTRHHIDGAPAPPHSALARA